MLEAFKRDQEEVRLLDAAANPELAGLTTTNVLQYMLNTAGERRIINAVAARLSALPLKAKIMAFEHDGLFVECKATRDEILEAALEAAGVPVTVEGCLSVKDALAKARERIAEDKTQGAFAKLWHDDLEWESHAELLRAASKAPLSHHGLFSEVVRRCPVISPQIPYQVEDVFKINPLQDKYMWYSVKLQQWIEGGPHGQVALKGVIQHICQMELSPYSIQDEAITYQKLRWDFSNSSFRDSVEKTLKEHLLVDAGFNLDPEGALRYLNFKGKVYDRPGLGFGIWASNALKALSAQRA